MTTIREFITQHPWMTNKAVAERLGVRVGSVKSIRCEMRGPLGKTKELEHQVRITPGLSEWLEKTRPKGVTMTAHLVSILVDAMHEDQSPKRSR